MSTTRKPYPSDVADADREFLLPYLTLMRADAPQRAHDLREVFNAIRYVVRTGSGQLSLRAPAVRRAMRSRLRARPSRRRVSDRRPLAAAAEGDFHERVDVGLLRFDLLAEFGHHAAEFRDHGVRVRQLLAKVVGRPHAGFNIAPRSG